MDKSLAFTPAYELARLIKAKELSPVELVDYFLERISVFNPTLKAYLTVVEDHARSAAKEAEQSVLRGGELPSLHGVPVAIKDTEFTKGIRTTGGSLVYRDFVPEEDGVTAERLGRAGAILLGKANTPEFALAGYAYNRLLDDDTHNPWDLDRTCGGSSGGSGAAVAAGLAPIAQGSDAGGSTRIPASWCGIFGLKQTQGLVPTFGSLAQMPLVLQIGPMTRTVRDAAIMLQALAGFDPRDPYSLRGEPDDFVAALESDLKGLRVAWSPAWNNPDYGFAKVDPEILTVSQSAARVFESLGCQVDEATPAFEDPHYNFDDVMLNAEAYAFHKRDLEERGDELVGFIREFIELGEKVTAHAYAQGLWQMQRIRMQLADFFDRFDLLLTPTMAMKPYRIKDIMNGDVHPLYDLQSFTFIANIYGGPSATVPCGFTEDGLPVGLQINGRIGDDATVLRASAAFEQARPWIQNIPPAAQGID